MSKLHSGIGNRESYLVQMEFSAVMYPYHKRPELSCDLVCYPDTITLVDNAPGFSAVRATIGSTNTIYRSFDFDDPAIEFKWAWLWARKIMHEVFEQVGDGTVAITVEKVQGYCIWRARPCEISDWTLPIDIPKEIKPIECLRLNDEFRGEWGRNGDLWRECEQFRRGDLDTFGGLTIGDCFHFPVGDHFYNEGKVYQKVGSNSSYVMGQEDAPGYVWGCDQVVVRVGGDG